MRSYLSTINWEPFSGENLPNHGFFSEIVTTSLARVGYKVEFLYLPWARALEMAKVGDVDGVMDVYWKKDRVEFLNFTDIAWKVKVEFIALTNTPIVKDYDGTLKSLKGYQIGVMNKSAQEAELKAAGVFTQAITNQVQNVKKLLAKRIDAVIVPRGIFFYQLKKINPTYDRRLIKPLQPPYKVYDMYVAFSKKKQNYSKLTEDFNRGLKMIKDDGTFNNIFKKHDVVVE